MSVGEKLRYYREAAGFTLKEVAEKLGINPQSVYKYEHDIVTNIPIKNLEKMAEIYGISPKVLLGWGNNEQEESHDVPATDEDLQMLKDNPDLRILLSAGSKLKKSDIEFLVQMARRMDEE